MALTLFPTLRQSSSAFWKGDPALESLQRVHGISFPSARQLEEWEQLQEEAASRDHRRIGKVGAGVIALGQAPVGSLQQLLCLSSPTRRQNSP